MKKALFVFLAFYLFGCSKEDAPIVSLSVQTYTHAIYYCMPTALHKPSPDSVSSMVYLFKADGRVFAETQNAERAFWGYAILSNGNEIPCDYKAYATATARLSIPAGSYYIITSCRPDYTKGVWNERFNDTTINIQGNTALKSTYYYGCNPFKPDYPEWVISN